MKQFTLKQTLLISLLVMGGNALHAQSTPEPDRLPSVTTDSIRNITATSARVYITLTDPGSPTPYTGVCWSLLPHPDFEDAVHTGTEVVTVDLSGSGYATLRMVEPNTIYYVRAVAYNFTLGKVVYGEEKQYKSGKAFMPSIITDSVGGISATAIGLYAHVKSYGNDPKAQFGCLVGDSANTTVETAISTGYMSRADNTWDENYFYGSLAGGLGYLKPDSTYYVRAYIQNKAGVSYGKSIRVTMGHATLAIATTDSINSITATSAKVIANLIGYGNDFNARMYLTMGTSPNPTNSDATLMFSDFFDTTHLIFNLTQLSANTTYYVRAYTENVVGVAYANELQFTTLPCTPAKSKIDSVRNITADYAYVYGRMLDMGNDPDATYGYCYSTSALPTIADKTNPDPYYPNQYLPNTTYYARPYAQNVCGVTYGNQVKFKTGKATLPVVRTDSIIDTYLTAGFVSCYVVDGGNCNPESGVCYSTSPNPTMLDSVRIGTYASEGVFSSYIFGLEQNTKYYVRAYSKNPAGITYGQELEFTTLKCVADFTTSYDTLNNTFTITLDSAVSRLAARYAWDFGDGATSTDSIPSHIYTVDGVYNLNLTVTLSNQTETCSKVVSIGKDSAGNIYRTSGFTVNVRTYSTVTGIAENISISNSISIFPNPTDGNSTILFGRSLTNGTMRITNMVGEKIVEKINCSGSKIQIDIANQPAGLYIVEVIENGVVYRGKLIKE
jgi:PKD repeat protein